MSVGPSIGRSIGPHCGIDEAMKKKPLIDLLKLEKLPVYQTEILCKSAPSICVITFDISNGSSVVFVKKMSNRRSFVCVFCRHLGFGTRISVNTGIKGIKTANLS